MLKKKQPKQIQSKRARKVSDSYYAPTIGINTANDKLANTIYTPTYKTKSDLIEFYQRNKIANNIVENLASDTTVKWRLIKSDNDVLVDILENNDKKLKTYEISADITRELAIYGVCYVLLLTNVNEFTIPLQKTEEIIKLIILNPTRISESPQLIDDFTDARFGEPKWYMYNNKQIDASRLIKLTSSYAPKGQVYQNKTNYPSILDSIYDDVIAYDINIRALTQMIQDSSIPIWKSKHVQNLLNQRNGNIALNQYLADQMINKSVYRTTIINEDDDFSRLEISNLTGVVAAIERVMESICAKSNQSMKKVFGLQAKGLSNDQNIDDGWIAYCKGWQTAIYDKLLGIIDNHVLNYNKINIDYYSEWIPVEVMSNKEESEILKNYSSAYKEFIDSGVLTPYRVAVELTKRNLADIPDEELGLLEAMAMGDNVGTNNQAPT